MSPRVACRRHSYRLAIGVKEKAKKPGADGDGYVADEQKCAIYQRKYSAGEHRNIVPGMNRTDRHSKLKIVVETVSRKKRVLRRVLFLAVISGLLSCIPQPYAMAAQTLFYVVDFYLNADDPK